VARDLRGWRGALPLSVFSARYRIAAASDESQFIEAALAGGGFEGHTVEPERWGPLFDWEGAREGSDEPLFNPQMALHWALYEGAAAADVSVLLDGYGGDFVVSHGAGRLTELAASGHLLAALWQARAVAREAGEPLLQLLRRYVVAPLAPAALRHPLRRRHGLTTVPPRSERAGHLDALRFGNHPFALGIADRAAACHQVEPRYPFLEPRLVEFCLGLPASEKLDGGLSRGVLRRGLAHTLPRAIATRAGKANLGSAFALGMGELGTRSDPVRRWSDFVLSRWRGRVTAVHAESEVSNG
jgi:asparagine synthase (glutamine-hydrolysing)